MHAKNSAHASTPLPAYLLFILLFLSLTAALISLTRALAGEDAALLHPSAGVTQSPPFSDLVFVIDAGHGGEDGGAVGYANGSTVLEKDINLAIATELAQQLCDAGADAVLTRRSDTLLYDRNEDYEGRKKALDMAARLAIAERAAADGRTVIFVSIHQNTFTDARYSGLQVYYSANAGASARLAQHIQDTAREQLAPNNDRATKVSHDIYLLKNLSCPAVLVECGFLSNPTECAALTTPQYQTRVAYAIFCALRQYATERMQAS